MFTSVGTCFHVCRLTGTANAQAVPPTYRVRHEEYLRNGQGTKILEMNKEKVTVNTGFGSF